MKLKIKSQPEDFIVDEIATIPILKHGPYAVYKMTKRGWNTMDALRQIADHAQVPHTKLSYGGKKDRHALTYQHITVEGKPIEPFKHDNIKLDHLGFSDQPMSAGLMEGNRFKITIRQITPEQIKGAAKALESVKASGYPNYFDDQRFGSWDPKEGFIAEKILKEHYNVAVKIFLTAIHYEEKSGDKARKQFFSKHWREWDVCLKEAKTGAERKAFSDLSKKQPNALENILRAIPREDLSMAFSAYQSFLWNELVRRLIAKKAVDSPLKSVRGVVGDYIFYERLERIPYDYLKKLKLQTAASNTRMPDNLTEILYAKLLKEREVTPIMFKTMNFQSFFKAYERSVLIKPKDLSWEAHSDHLILSFSLPKAAYGTILIKRLFVNEP